LEEDTGKLMHLPSGESGIDYNRAGVPLMEIVTEFPPDIQDADEAREYLVQLRQILLYLGVCDGKMEEGSLRCEPNISVRPNGSPQLGTKTELKNLNSFKSVQLGVGFEIARQIAILEDGGEVLQETRGWNEAREESFLMRIKEAENDYRYFPDPDLVPMHFEQGDMDELKKALPELPLAKSERYQRSFGLDFKESWEFIVDAEWAAFFEDAVSLGGDPRAVRNVMVSEFARHLNRTGIPARESRVTPAHIVEIAKLLLSGQITSKMGKEVFDAMFEDGRMPAQIIEESGVAQISDEGQLGAIIQEVLRSHPDVVAKFKDGQLNVKGFLIGQIMRQSKGQANPQIVQDLLQQALEQA
jgi:aspartyl-tRNA(Asn)/glutamyl-tRNA(Gln) amidotransferase subunit B